MLAKPCSQLKSISSVIEGVRISRAFKIILRIFVYPSWVKLMLHLRDGRIRTSNIWWTVRFTASF